MILNQHHLLLTANQLVPVVAAAPVVKVRVSQKRLKKALIQLKVSMRAHARVGT